MNFTGSLKSLLILLLCSSLAYAGGNSSGRICLIGTGLGGMPEYEENFLKWGSSVEELCREELNALVVRLDGREKKRQDFLRAFAQVTGSLGPGAELWFFLIGHGTYDGREYKFNISGPDLRGGDLSEFLSTLAERSAYVIVGTSSSGVLASELSAANRVIVTATKSGQERQAPLFMSFFIEGARSAGADLDKNGTVSLREIFTFSERGVKDWYEGKGLIQTEHPLLDDSGGKGSLASLAYLSNPPEASYRSLQARELAPDKVRLEREIEELKLRKAEMSESAYYQRLEEVLVELATLNEKIRQLEGEK